METKRTVKDIVNMKRDGRKISVLTAYDAGFARMLDAADIDILLVGDSLGNVLLGYDSTVPVTMEEMLHHCKAVARGTASALLVGDMPFMSYQVRAEEAIANGGRFLKEAGCDAVKVEGGQVIANTVKMMVRAGVPVMGHIGLTPQTASSLGGYKVQGGDFDTARKLVADARGLEAAGVFSLVLECIPSQLGRIITEAVSIPTIGIGAGRHCDGQVLVTHDLLGMFEKFIPRFVKKYVNLAPQIKEAVNQYNEEVRSGKFPDDAHGYAMQEDVLVLLENELRGKML